MELTIKLDKRNKQAEALFEYLKTLPFVRIVDQKKDKETQPYNSEFVEKVLHSAQHDKRYEVNPDNVWESLGLE
ncbi:MAG: hypothetical protein CSB02_00850 [Bacteroidia bacterium]|nr:MAG: hypothetical protein CSB02_00850 [Bacteroidia bacterium]